MSAQAGIGELRARAESLRGVRLFEDLKSSDEALLALVSIMKERRYVPGSTIIQEGTVGSEMYVLISGKVSVYKTTPEGDAFKVAVLGSEVHPIFGESGLIDTEPRSATIRVDSDATCLLLDREAFDRFARELPQWALPIYRRIAQAVLARVKKSNEDIMLLYKALMDEVRGY